MAKALNKKNLLALGPDRLAELLLEVTKGRADAQRRLRLELSAHSGAEDVARDIRKRYASIRLAKGYLSRKTHRTFAKEIRSLIALIEQGVAPGDPGLGFDLLWELLHLAPGVLRRTKDSGDILAEAFADVMAAVERIGVNVTVAPVALAETVFEAVREDGGDTFAGAVRALAAPLGAEGLAHLRSLAVATLGARRGKAARSFADRRVAGLLRDIADVQGDVDGYAAGFTPAQMTQPAIAADVGARLLAAGRAEEALALAEAAMDEADTPEVAGVLIRSLEALGRKDALRAFLWACFQRRPDADRLRRYLRLLPDFDDIEAEDEARILAQTHPDTEAALRFFVQWPDLAAAAALVRARADRLAGTEPDLIAHAEAIEGRDALAGILIRRAVILALLRSGSVAADRRAADHLAACAVADAAVADYGDFPDHLSFITALRRLFGRRKAFWDRVA
ncbi:DUF6880 family protein [Falsirhodobacter xinxiangensis]|uniref:DUF6880 family protein n=1 Tax=Falsirhodobacter xinxiangensis TaxID=2530049 RepID=UPI0010A9ACF5|nr:DUF6880 family protein [Rhodobacter xinxiangensis]